LHGIPSRQPRVCTCGCVPLSEHALFGKRNIGWILSTALKDLCEIMNAEQICFPQTQLKTILTAPAVAAVFTPCQKL
jgi:hypothetical protein